MFGYASTSLSANRIDGDSFFPIGFMNHTLTYTTTANTLKVIDEQQSVDLTDKSLEAWAQMRRSGTAGNEVPLLSLPIQAPVGGIARRWKYPDIELTGNNNSPTTFPKMHEVMWFNE